MPEKLTEQSSLHDHLEQRSVMDLLQRINGEDQKVPQAITQVLPQIESLIETIVSKLNQGGRLFYIGAGTSGRMGILDASECPPTFGVDHDLVIGLIAGGESAIRKAVEFAEDNIEQGWKDLKAFEVSEKDVVIGIAASGTTPYVIGALKSCQQHNIVTGSISCNAASPLSIVADHPIEVIVGPEFVTGSTRMKSGTAQKLVLNMISTTTMIQLGRVQGNKMVDMQLSNDKLVIRGARMLQEQLNISKEQAEGLLAEHKSVRKAISAHQHTHGS